MVIFKEKIKCFFDTLSACVETNNISSKKSFLVSIFLVALSIFLTIIGQVPFFSSRGITQILQIFWLFSIIPLFLFSYKLFLRNILYILCLITPFCIYLIIATVFNIPSFSFEATKLIFLMVFIFFIGFCLSKFQNSAILKLFSFSYIIGSFVYATILYFSKLKGVDISGSIYAVSSKNSAGPIFMIAIIFSLYFFDKKRPLSYILKYSISLVFLILIFMMKCRTVIAALVVMIPYFIYFTFTNNRVRLIIFAVLCSLVLLIIFVPALNQRIIHDILLNGKTEIDDIFSGRLTSITNAFNDFKPILGSGNTYIECMPLCFLTTYGILGSIFLLPILILPILILVAIKFDRKTRFCINLLLVLFFFEWILEGFGYVGPGAKSFPLWLLSGIFIGKFFEISYFDKYRNSLISKNINHAVLKLDNKSITVALQSVLILLSSLSIVTSFFGGSLAVIINSKLPSSSMITDYYEPGNINIIRPVESMCSDQRITIDFKPENEIYDDMEGRISNYTDDFLDRISVNPERNELTGIYGWSCFQCNVLRGKSFLSYYMVYHKEDYVFDRIHISGHEYSRSFEHVNDENIFCGLNQYTKIYVDNYYVPDGVARVYKSTDESIAKVDDKGNIFGVSPGTCEVYVEVSNDKGKFRNINRIEVTVLSDDNYISTNFFDLDVSGSFFQYEPVALNYIFNKNATFTDVNMEIFGTDNFTIKNNSIIFNDSGGFDIKFTSVANPSLSKCLHFEIKENRPISFTTEINRLLVGREYSSTDLGLKINYSSGNSFIVNDSDLYYDALNFSGRAWHDKNGIVKNRTTLKTVLTGSVNLTVVSKADQTIKNSFTFEVSKFELNEYNERINNISLIFITILLLLTIIYSLFVNIARKKIKYCIELLSPIIMIAILVCYYRLSILSIIVACVLEFIAIIVFVIDLFILKGKPLFYLNDEFVSSSDSSEREISI